MSEKTVEMFQVLTFLHAATRWLVLAALIYVIFRAYRGKLRGAAFSKGDNAVRHWTATIAHVQLTIGIILYTQSPLVKYFWNNFSVAVRNPDAVFFGLFHIAMMLGAVVLVTVGSSLAKRRAADGEKFATMVRWFSVALAVILLAVPWPFYPFAARPWLR